MAVTSVRVTSIVHTSKFIYVVVYEKGNSAEKVEGLYFFSRIYARLVKLYVEPRAPGSHLSL